MRNTTALGRGIFHLARRFWRWLVVPAPSVRDPERRLMTQWLATVVVTMMPLGFLVSALPVLVGVQTPQSYRIEIETALIAIFFAAVSLVLCRYGYFEAAGSLYGTIASIAIFYLAITDRETAVLQYLVVPIVIVSAFLPTLVIYLYLMANVLAMFLLPLWIEEATFAGVLVNPTSFFILGVPLALLIARFRDVVFAFRTSALAKANVALQAEVDVRERAEQAERQQRILAEALRDSAAALTGTLELEEVLTRILENIDRVVPHDAANIMMVEADEVLVTHWRGYSPDAEAVLKSTRFSVDMSVLYRMYKTGQFCLIPNIQESNNGWYNWPEAAWVQSYVGAPIQIHGTVLGFLNLDSARQSFYTSEHARRLMAFADQAAVAIQNARLFEQVKRYSTELELNVSDRTTELWLERLRLRAVLDAMRDGVFYVDEDMSIGFINQALVDLTGYSRETILARAEELFVSAMVVEDPSAMMQTIIGAVQQTGSWQGELQLRRKSGVVVDVSISMTATYEPDGRYAGTVAIIRDVSQDKALQAQKDRFIANASHELRTPVANIVTRLWLARRQPDRLNEHLAVIEQSTSHMCTLIEDLLLISRLEENSLALEQTLQPLQGVFSALLEQLQPSFQASGITPTVDLPADSLPIYVDLEKMVQALNNLAIYALGCMPPDGDLAFRADREGQTVGIRLDYDGPVLSVDARLTIFEPFSQATEGQALGTRLGLAVARRIILLHGGEIKAESLPEQGNAFVIRLPLVGDTPD